MSAHPPLGTLRRGFRGLAVAVLIALSGGACESVTGPLDEERDRLEQARTQWRSQRLQDYQYVYQRSCFCAPGSNEPMTITVRGNAIQSVVRVSDGERQDPALFDTIDGIFDLLEEAIDGNAAQLHADYHPGLGYPTSGFIDRDERLADEELSFTATDLQPQR